MSAYHLAQINVGTLRAPLDAPEIAGFKDNLDAINALADGHPGFIWRLKGDGNNATDIQLHEDPLRLINMSMWTDVGALAAFVYRTQHRDIMRGRAQWFHKLELFMALWWVPAGHQPKPQEGLDRLETLRRLGPTAQAFTFREPFAAPDMSAPPESVLDACA